MGTDRLYSIIHFTGVPIGGTATLPHGLVLRGTPVEPDLIFVGLLNSFEYVSADTVTVTIRNISSGAGVCDVWVQAIHPAIRLLGLSPDDGLMTQGMTPRPFAIQGVEAATSKPGLIIIGDSNGFGFSSPLPPADQSNPGFNPTAIQSLQFVFFDMLGSLAANDPPAYGPEVIGGVQPYPTVGGGTLMGMDITVGQELTRQAVAATLSVFAVAGIACAQMVPSPVPPYPTIGPSWYQTMVNFQRGVEISQNAVTRVAIISAGVNDGLDAAESAALAANMTLLVNQLPVDFPGIVIIWGKINNDTLLRPGFIPATITNQLAGFAANPQIKQLWCDDLALQTDHTHYTANSYMTQGQRAVWMALDGIGRPRPRPRPIQPAIIMGYGPATADNGTGNPSGWGGAIAGDLEILINCQIVGAGDEGTLTTPAGWDLLGQATSTTGPGGFSSRIAVFERLITAAMLNANHGNTAPTSMPMDPPNTLNYCQIITIRGPSPYVSSPVDFVQFSTTNTATTTYTLLGNTTTQNSELIVMATVGFTGITGAACPVSLTADDMVGVTVVKNGVNATPDEFFGVMDVQQGIKEIAGVVGNLTATLGTSTTCPVGVMLAIKQTN